MTRTYLSLLAFVGLTLFFTSCKKLVGTGPAVSETRSVTGFSGIDLSINATVNITADSIFSVEAIAQRNILDMLRTRLDGSDLCISYQPELFVKPTEDVILNIHMPTLNNIDVSGSGKVNTLNAIQTNTIDLDVSGSGKMNLNALTAIRINSAISGSGKITINNGTSNSLYSKISGSGDLDAINVMTNSVNTNTSGSGTTKVYATQNLDVRISGSGDVYYRGNPAVNSDISGSGKIIHQN